MSIFWASKVLATVGLTNGNDITGGSKPVEANWLGSLSRRYGEQLGYGSRQFRPTLAFLVVVLMIFSSYLLLFSKDEDGPAVKL